MMKSGTLKRALGLFIALGFAAFVVGCGGSTPEATPMGDIEIIEPAFGSQLERGQALYAANCAGCHGANGEGLGPFPALNGSQHAYKHPDWEFVQLIKEGRNSMPAFGSKLSDAEIVDLIARLKAWWGPGQLSEQRDLCLLLPPPTPIPD